MKKITLITGAGRGIGFGIARLFAKKKHNLILTIRKKNQIKNLIKLKNENINVKIIIGDFRGETIIKELKKIPKIDNLICNVSGENTKFFTKVSKKELDGDIPLPEAELVVSAGRGLKGPENWGIVEDLAKTIGAATACSRPVSDIGWRPHHEHVGQTGIAIRPNLYIAAGISGAIQHLAGVNGSKVIVVINTDPEAPFFKAADYGIVGDAFEVLPKLNDSMKRFKAENN